jgi:trans-aconitate methyltransferase
VDVGRYSLDPTQISGIIGGRERRSVVDERDARRNREASERLDRLTREGYKTAVDQAFEAQKSGMRLSRRFFENWVETLDDQAELNRRALGSLQQLVREQSEVFRVLSRESVDAYDGFLYSLDAYEEYISNLDKRED